jgi:hypothetical protein
MTATTVSMFVPASATGIVNGQSGSIYTIGNDGIVPGVLSGDILPLLNAGFRFVSPGVKKLVILAPLPADLTTVVNAVTPTNVALTIAAQPPQARKLQVRVVIGTTTTTAITAGTLTLVGVDQDGIAISEAISLIQNASATLKSTWAYAKLTSATVSNYVASGSGTGNTIGLGPSNDFGVPSAPRSVDLALVKATKIITTVTGGVTAWARAVTDDVAASATVDTVARTVAPTTAPGVAGINDYEFSYTYNAPA